MADALPRIARKGTDDLPATGGATRPMAASAALVGRHAQRTAR